MSDHDGVEPTPESSSPHPTRRSVLQAGLLALAATHMPDSLVSRSLAQGAKPSTNLAGKLPVLLENQQKGNYRVHLDPSDQGADVGLFCNQSFDKDPEIARWLSTREFLIALSHGIDRTPINETFVLGLGQVASAAGERTLYFPGPEYKMLHVGYDVKKANEMVDALGLTRKDGEGYPRRRRRPAAAGAHDVPRLPAVHAHRGDDRRAVEEDRHPRRGAGDGAGPGHRAYARQRAPDLLRDPVGRRQHVRSRTTWATCPSGSGTAR